MCISIDIIELEVTKKLMNNSKFNKCNFIQEEGTLYLRYKEDILMQIYHTCGIIYVTTEDDTFTFNSNNNTIVDFCVNHIKNLNIGLFHEITKLSFFGGK